MYDFRKTDKEKKITGKSNLIRKVQVLTFSNRWKVVYVKVIVYISKGLPKGLDNVELHITCSTNEFPENVICKFCRLFYGLQRYNTHPRIPPGKLNQIFSSPLLYK